jgi:hypothetical protein
MRYNFALAKPSVNVASAIVGVADGEVRCHAVTRSLAPSASRPKCRFALGQFYEYTTAVHRPNEAEQKTQVNSMVKSPNDKSRRSDQ